MLHPDHAISLVGQLKKLLDVGSSKIRPSPPPALILRAMIIPICQDTLLAQGFEEALHSGKRLTPVQCHGFTRCHQTHWDWPQGPTQVLRAGHFDATLSSETAWKKPEGIHSEDKVILHFAGVTNACLGVAMAVKASKANTNRVVSQIHRNMRAPRSECQLRRRPRHSSSAPGQTTGQAVRGMSSITPSTVGRPAKPLPSANLSCQ